MNKIDGTLRQGRDDDDETALTLASKTGSRETVQYLITDLEFDIHEKGSDGSNCFLSAAKAGNIENMKHLNSVDKTLRLARNCDHDTALTLASGTGSKEAVEYLITELEVDIHETGFHERNCFLRAAEGGKIETMRYLNSIDKTLSRTSGSDHSTSLTLASQYASKETVKYSRF